MSAPDAASPRVPDPAQAPPLTWGVLGAGWAAGQMVRAITRHTTGRVVAIGTRNPDRARAFAAEHGIEAWYSRDEETVSHPGLDAIYIATPHSEHQRQALLALEGGLAVLVEKCFTRNRREAEEVLSLAADRSLFVMEAMWSRFLPHMAQVRAAIADREIGEILSITADHGQRFPEDPRHRGRAPELAGGALLDLGVYPIAFAMDLLGTPERVVASGSLTATGVDGQSLVSLHYADGVTAHAHSTIWARTPTVASVVGTRGRIDLASDFYKPTTVTISRDDGASEFLLPIENGFEFEAAETARCIASGLTESALLPWQEIVDRMGVLDEARAQLGVRYPGEAVLLP